MPLDLRATVVEGKVYRTKKKQEGDDEKQAMRELATILGTKRRQACNCEAQIHDLLENCLECGRFTCSAEGSGPCLNCGATVLSQDQRERLMKHLDFLRPSTASASLVSGGTRTKIIDNQYDHFAIDRKKHLREEDRSRMKSNLEELQAKRYQRKLMLDIDIDNLEAGSRSMPQVDDYEAELRKLQLEDSTPVGTNSGITLAQLVVEESKNNYRFEYVDPNVAKKSQRAKSEGVVVNIGSTTQKQKHSQLKNKSNSKKSTPKRSSSKPPNVWSNHTNNDNKDTKK